jgi:hypothetical protein
LVILAGLAGLGIQRRETLVLRERRAGQEQLAAEAARLAAEHQRLAAAQVPADELARRREDRTVLTALANELESIRLRTKAEPLAGSPAPAAAGRPSLRRAQLAAEDWMNRGAADPDAAFETALWAAAHGDLDTLAGLLVFEEDARAAATALFDRLPTALRGEMDRPEKLMALLTAKAIPLGSARILTQTHDDGEAKLVAELHDPAGRERDIQVTLRASGDRWQLVVPVTAVDKFIDQLRPPSVALTPVTVPPGP